MTKEEVVSFLEDGHREMQKVLANLTPEQMTEERIFDDWAVKDVLAHLVAWKWEYEKEIDRVLNNQATWQSFEGKVGEDAFNQKVVADAKERTIEEVLADWEKAHRQLLDRTKTLSPSEYKHQSGGDTWSTGDPLTVASLFEYEYNGLEHEAGHAKQIKEKFHLVE